MHGCQPMGAHPSNHVIGMMSSHWLARTVKNGPQLRHLREAHIEESQRIMGRVFCQSECTNVLRGRAFTFLSCSFKNVFHFVSIPLALGEPRMSGRVRGSSSHVFCQEKKNSFSERLFPDWGTCRP